MHRDNLADIRARNNDDWATEASGYRISRTLVLTAKHAVVAGDGRPFQRIDVHLGDPKTHRVRCSAVVRWIAKDHDAALLRIEPAASGRRLPKFAGPPVQWGALRGSGQVAVTGVGFPRFAEYDGDVRQVDQISGPVSPLSMGSDDGTFPIPVRDPPGMSLDDDELRPWQGFSGSAVFTDNPPGTPSGSYRRLLIGVVVADDRQFEYRRIHALSVAEFTGDADFVRHLTEDGLARPKPVSVEDHNDRYLTSRQQGLTLVTRNGAWTALITLEALGNVSLLAALGPVPSLVYGYWYMGLTATAWLASFGMARWRAMRRRSLAGAETASEAEFGSARGAKLRAEAERLHKAVLRTQEENQAEALAVTGLERAAPADLPYSIDDGGEGSLASIGAHFARLDPQRLVVLGGPGSGKTVLATELIRRLRHDDPAAPLVPMMISLANWAQVGTNGPAGSLAEFIALQMHVDYGTSMGEARDLVRLGWVLPVLDGLDEMDRLPGVPATAVQTRSAPRAKLAIEKINAYCRQFSDAARLVVTCRTEPYDTQLVRIADATVIRMRQLDAERVLRFVEPVIRNRPLSAQWQPVLEALRANPSSRALQELRTPWRLTLALAASSTPTADETRYLFDPEALVMDPAEDGRAAAGEDSEQIKDELLGHFASAVLSHQQARIRASVHRERVSFTVPDDRTMQRWLHELARYLADYGDTKLSETQTISAVEINLHTMWPVAGRRAARMIHLGIHLLCAVLFIVPVSLAVLGRPTDAAATVTALAHHTTAVDPLTSKRLVFVVAASVILVVWATWLALTSSPRRSRTKSAGFRSHAMRRMGIGARLVTAAEIAIAIGGAFALLAYLLSGAVAAAVTGLLIGGGFALVMDKVRLDRGLTGGFDAWTAWRNDVGLGVALASIAALVFEVFLVYPWWAGAVFGFVLGFSGAFVLSLQAWLRYTIAMTVMKLRKRLPWRLGAFLFWGQQAGLFRISGTGYQYRHDELRGWYAQQTHLGQRHDPARYAPQS